MMAHSRRPPPTSRCSTSLRRSASAPASTRLPTRAERDTLRGMRDAVTQGPAEHPGKARRRYIAEAAKHNGYLLGDIGHYGTDYELRAITDKVGVGALKPKVAIYAFAQTDRDLGPLTGDARYVLHLPADQLPVPATGVLVDDPLRRRRCSSSRTRSTAT